MTCNRDKNSMKGKGCAFRNTIACRALRALGGGSFENDMQS